VGDYFEVVESSLPATATTSSQRRIAVPQRLEPRQPFSLPTTPRGSEAPTNLNQDGSFQRAIEPVVKAFLELTTSILSLSRFLFSHQMEDPQKHIVDRIQRRIHQDLAKNKQESKPSTTEKLKQFQQQQVERKKTTTRTNNETVLIPNQSVTAMVFFPSRVLKLTVAAWILSETLDMLGILNDDTPQLLRSQVDRVWYDVYPKLILIKHTFQGWWDGAITLENLEKIPSKYNFAIGTSLGLIVSPVMLVASGSLWQPALVIYILAEVNANLRARGRWNLGSVRKQLKFGSIVERFFERVRRFVRSSLPQPQAIDGALVKTTGGGSQYTGKHISKRRSIVQRNTKSKQNNELMVLPPKTQPDHPIVLMLRHGFLVGSFIGLCLRV
jgi:hypothetical protein